MGEEVDQDFGDERRDERKAALRENVDVLPHRGKREKKEGRINWGFLSHGLPWLVILVGVGICVVSEPVAVGAVVMMGGFCWVFYDLVISQIVKAHQLKNISEEEYEKEWREKSEILEKAVTAAEIKYAEGPFGIWRHSDWEGGVRSNLIVWESRAIAFLAEGRGVYRWYRKIKSDREFEVRFQYKVEEGRNLLVKLLDEPVETDWVKVEYGFEAKNKGEDLLLWFEAENPLPPEFFEYWPFVGEFLRAAG